VFELHQLLVSHIGTPSDLDGSKIRLKASRYFSILIGSLINVCASYRIRLSVALAAGPARPTRCRALFGTQY
jgi:hypothetical protein